MKDWSIAAMSLYHPYNFIVNHPKGVNCTLILLQIGKRGTVPFPRCIYSTFVSDTIFCNRDKTVKNQPCGNPRLGINCRNLALLAYPCYWLNNWMTWSWGFRRFLWKISKIDYWNLCYLVWQYCPLVKLQFAVKISFKVSEKAHFCVCLAFFLE